MAVNKVILIGNVGRDPEIRHMQGGASVASFTLATTERYKDKNGEAKELTEWHNIVAWRQLSDLAEKFIRKGSQIYVEGRIRSRNWEDQNGQKRYITEILADSIQLLGRRSDNPTPTDGAYADHGTPAAAEPRYQYQQPRPTATQAPSIEEDDADDLPF